MLPPIGAAKKRQLRIVVRPCYKEKVRARQRRVRNLFFYMVFVKTLAPSRVDLNTFIKYLLQISQKCLVVSSENKNSLQFYFVSLANQYIIEISCTYQLRLQLLFNKQHLKLEQKKRQKKL
nr:hypothetical protein [Halimeda borneensis]